MCVFAHDNENCNPKVSFRSENSVSGCYSTGGLQTSFKFEFSAKSLPI